MHVLVNYLKIFSYIIFRIVKETAGSIPCIKNKTRKDMPAFFVVRSKYLSAHSAGVYKENSHTSRRMFRSLIYYK